MTDKISFEEAKAALAKLGATYYLDYEYRGTPGVDRKSHELPRFTALVLPLSPESWMSLVRNDGKHYIGGCCASSSAMQDIVCHWFRFADEGVKISELAKIAHAQIEHDGEESLFHEMKDLLKTIMGRDDWSKPPPGKYVDPWWLIAALWHLVKDNYTEAAPHASADHLSPLAKAISIVERSCMAISWDRLFSSPDGEPKPLTSQAKVTRAVLLARFLPAIKLLSERATDLYYGPVNGFAIIDSDTGPKAIATNGYGYCIYTDQTEITALFDAWDKESAMYEERKTTPSRERFAIRPVRVDIEHGITFTDTNEPYEGTNA